MLRLFLVFITLLLTSGCAGTMLSRSGNAHFGKPVYGGVILDGVAVCISIIGHDEISKSTGLIMGLSIPVDLAVDTVLLPADLVLWSLGNEKDGWGIGP